MNNYEDDLGLSYIVGDWPALEKTILENVTDWSTCIQAGGHFGTYPKNLARMFNTVYTFEADKENYAILAENCKDQKNIIHYNVALSAYERTMDVKKVMGGNSGQRLVFPGTEIPAITIDSLNLTSCGLIQLDIERHELYAIMGAIRTIEQFRPVIILEGPEVTNNACDIILDQLGYEFAGRAGYDSVFKYTGKMGKFAEFNDSIQQKKKILIAIPTARYIEADTFKSIYDLEVPEGYEVTYQHFYGYRVDQVRNLIADWVVHGFDYLFSVDHDVTFPPDTLKRLLEHNVDLISGVYRQRLEPQRIEIYDLNQNRMEYSDIHNQPIVQIGGCGFGCVLIRKEVFVGVGYPQFEYHPALDHNNTISEDTDFCKKAMDKRFNLWCDPSILCGHIGSTTMHVQIPQVNKTETHLRNLASLNVLSQDYINYMWDMKSVGFQPKVIYDIGACVLHWTKEARKVWPQAEFIPFEAMSDVQFLYKEAGFKDYAVGCLLSDVTGEEVEFYENIEHPGGNSMYKENSEYSPSANELFPENKKVKRRTNTLDDIVKLNGLPQPDLIKMDIQGAELKALKGAEKTLENCSNIIIELQHKEYNLGAALKDEVIEYLNSIGFRLMATIRVGEVDGDYHFIRP